MLPAAPVSSVSVDCQRYPSSQPHARDWDKLVAELKEEEKEEKPEGDAALNALFHQIYANGSDETRKAMNKSFVSHVGHEQVVCKSRRQSGHEQVVCKSCRP